MVAKSTKVRTKQTGGLIMSRADRLCENSAFFSEKWTNKWGLGRTSTGVGGDVSDARGDGRHGD